MHILTVTHNAYCLNYTCIALKPVFVINMKKAASVGKPIAGLVLTIQCDLQC